MSRHYTFEVGETKDFDSKLINLIDKTLEDLFLSKEPKNDGLNGIYIEPENIYCSKNKKNYSACYHLLPPNDEQGRVNFQYALNKYEIKIIHYAAHHDKSTLP
ncbi:unnamed protein product, partial [Didymodactylos carnosus]